jgi:2-keto-4-pentenoate hydratase/2-oxohepta-3-ene-1,7-dioic acid hydratase in catechol pathway
MRLASFAVDDRFSYGIVERGMIREAAVEFRTRFPDLRAVLTAGQLDALTDAVASPVPLGGVTLLPPIPNPDKIICVGQNYIAHIREMGNEPGEYPAIFTRYSSSMRGHGAELVRPKASEKYDFEGELALVIGRAGRAIPAGAALDHVAGYTCFMDGSIRDFQRHTSQFWPGKNFTATGSMGPWIVTDEEIGDPAGQVLSTHLNGTEVQSSPVSDLAASVPDIIAYVSQVTELLPGDVIATGTPGGVGAARKPPLWLKPGDSLDVRISGIGTLSNTIVDEA